ncbi:MAG TPA: VOC family protein [Actinocrinis sp.]|jgi:hypothetical protein
MTSRFTELIIDARDPRRLADFWCAVLDYHVVEVRETWVEIAPWRTLSEQPPVEEVRHSPRIPTIIFVKVPDDKVVKNRVHLDILPSDGDLGDEVARLVGLGASRADIGQGEQEWIVLADPEGNEFCVGSLILPEPA